MRIPAVIAISILANVAGHAAVSLDAKNDSSVLSEKDPALKEPVKGNPETPSGKAFAAFAAGEHEKAVKLAIPLAETGDADAIYLLGFAHETGQGAEASREKAMEYYRKGLTRKHADSIYRLSFLLLASNEDDQVQEGRKLLETQAVTDPAVAGRILGEAFLRGNLSPEPAPKTAISWWKKASEAGDVPSMFFLARLYDGQFGQPSVTDPKLAYDYFLKAAEKGNANAMVAVGSRLLNSDTIKRDEKKGVEWLNKAIESEDYSAYLALGDYQENVKKDLKAAFGIYEKGTEAGQPDCMIRAAVMHMEGKGTDKDEKRGIVLLEKAASAGVAQAHLMLAAKMMENEKPDIANAYAHLLTSANAGMPLAQNELGLFYLSGKLGVADISAALSWFGRSAQAGFAAAQNNLAALHERGTGVEQSYEKAGKLYALAAQQGHASATLALARFHAAGAGTKVNKELAWALAKLATERGETENSPALITELEKGFSKEQLEAAKKELARIKSDKPAE